jgi:hypothetical protein
VEIDDKWHTVFTKEAILMLNMASVFGIHKLETIGDDCTAVD